MASGERREERSTRRAGELDPGRARTAGRIASVLLVLDLLYVLWVNYVAFVGGNWPLTPFHFTNGSPGKGAAMLAVGDWVLLFVLFFVVNPVVMAGVHLVQRQGTRRPPKEPASVPKQAADFQAVQLERLRSTVSRRRSPRR